MNKVQYIYRSKKRNEPSIETLFETMMPYFKTEFETSKVFLPHERYNNLKDIISNIAYVKQGTADIYHITGEVQFCILNLPKNRTILTFHDFSHLDAQKGVKKIISWLFFHYIPFKRAKYIVCISNTVKERLIKDFPSCEKKCFYIPNSLDDTYEYIPKIFNESLPNILVVGTRKNKNVDRIIEAIKDLTCHLTVIGQLTDKQLNRLDELEIEYDYSFNLTSNEVLNKYKQCDILCFPSLYEGFGRPIIEVNSIGRIVVTSSINPMIEVSNGSTILVDPSSVNSIKQGLLTAIEDEKLRESKIEKGLENAKRFSANRVAKEYMKLYYNILNNMERE